MKVALDVSAVPAKPAGAGRYIVEVARRLPKRKVATTLITRRSDVERWKDWSPEATLQSVVPDARPLRLLFEATSLGRRAPAVDVWHGPHYTMPHHAKLPTVVTICDLTFFTNPEWHERSKVLFFQRAIRYAAERATVLLSISHTTTQLLQDIVGPTAPIVTAPLGVDLERFSPPGASSSWSSPELPTEVPYLFFLGTFEPRKGLDVLLEAFTHVASANADVELWLAGQAGWGTGDVADQIRNHRYATRIRQLGYVSDEVLPELLRHAAAVVYPSRGEGFGLPVLEALATGSVVVTSSNTVMEEVAGTAAQYAPVGDATAVAEACLSALTLSASERSDVAVAARRQAERFTWDATMDGHLRAYELAVTHGRR